ncbi:MAG: prepilin-type N-terminal cleavage/methylation domain-containing protein [Oligoflexus sp.]|nr:prepilin-type N-terminal cleavage/methylation domain-containing protein [Oligoflexus sp.]
MLKSQKKSLQLDLEAGFSLVEIIFALAILSIVILAAIVQSSRDQELSRKTHDKLNRSEIERAVRQNLDCNATTEALRIKLKDKFFCASTSINSTAPWFMTKKRVANGVIKDSFNDAVLDDAGSFAFGSNRIRISCSTEEASLIVQARPQNGREIKDWNYDKYLVIGEGVNRFACFDKDDRPKIERFMLDRGKVTDLNSPDENLNRTVYVQRDGGIACNEDETWGMTSCVPTGSVNIPNMKVNPIRNGCKSSSPITITCFKYE